jgi:6-phosphogluconolactonase
MSNAVAGNAVLAYRRATDGSLTFQVAYPTGGTGMGAGLGNQGAVTLSDNGRWLFVVNAGSSSVSVFRRASNGVLTLVDTEPTGGNMPVCVANRGSLVYVLNAGGSGNISGFSLSSSGTLTPLAGSLQALSQAGAGGAQLAFTNSGSAIFATERLTNRILVFPLSSAGVASAAHVYNSTGVTPFGFAVDNSGRFIVSNATGGGAGAGTLTSYLVNAGGGLQVLDGPVADLQTAPCWVAVSRNGRFAYTTNAGSRTISGFEIGAQGQLTLLNLTGVSASTSGAPTDLAVTGEGRSYIYVLNSAAGIIDVFMQDGNGGLQPVAGGVTGMAPGANGMAAI